MLTPKVAGIASDVQLADTAQAATKNITLV